MDVHFLHDLLTPEQLGKIREMLNQARWTDGKISGGKGDNKSNEEMVQDGGPLHIEVLKIVEAALRNSPEFQMLAWPRYMTRPIISRYEKGMYYRSHTDFPVQHFHIGPAPAYKALAPVGSNYIRTDLSVTLFLADADTYDGGELCFDRYGRESERHKMPAGSAVLYPTGVPHSVAEVTRGVRLAAIFWVQSMFPNAVHRSAVNDACRLYMEVEKLTPDTTLSHLAETNFHNIFRNFAEV